MYLHNGKVPIKCCVACKKTRNEIWHKGSIGCADDARTSNTRLARMCAEKSHDAILDGVNVILRYNHLNVV